MSTVPAGIVQNLRLPGQEFDVETGLYHNGFRDYAPGWGRYLQSDPIGLAGGMNTYGYVRGNPVRSIDPLGLLCALAEEGEGAHSFADFVKDAWAFYKATNYSPEEIEQYLHSPHSPSSEDAAELAGIAYNLANSPDPPVFYSEEAWEAEYTGQDLTYLTNRRTVLQDVVNAQQAAAASAGLSFAGSEASLQLSAVNNVLARLQSNTPLIPAPPLAP